MVLSWFQRRRRRKLNCLDMSTNKTKIHFQRYPAWKCEGLKKKREAQGYLAQPHHRVNWNEQVKSLHSDCNSPTNFFSHMLLFFKYFLKNKKDNLGRILGEWIRRRKLGAFFPKCHIPAMCMLPTVLIHVRGRVGGSTPKGG